VQTAWLSGSDAVTTDTPSEPRAATNSQAADGGVDATFSATATNADPSCSTVSSAW
jgi:hypothetical protein